MRIPGLAQWVEDLALLWLWHRLAVTVQIRPLAWEPTYAGGAALKRKKKKKKAFLVLALLGLVLMLEKWGFKI